MLQSLRKKTERTRIIMTLGVTLVLTCIIVFFWIWSTAGRFSDSQKTIKDSVKPFGILKDSMVGVFKNHKESYPDGTLELEQEEQVSENAYAGDFEIMYNIETDDDMQDPFREKEKEEQEEIDSPEDAQGEFEVVVDSEVSTEE